MKRDHPEGQDVALSATLNNAEVCQDAIDAAAALAPKGKEEFERFYAYLLVDEPIIQLMPWYFLPPWSGDEVNPETLRALAVAAKLENARNRWLDEMADKPTPPPSLTSPQGLNGAIVGLTNRLYASVLSKKQAACFFERLAMLYARHSVSLLLDSKRLEQLGRSLTLAEYEDHAKARHSSVRAPLDALLILTGAAEEQHTLATDSWHAWGLGAQLYDDALDVEEDFRNANLTWTVGRTLEHFGERSPESEDEFYGVSLKEGVVAETLEIAEARFAQAAELARSSFPRWMTVQHGCMRQARALREDYERLIESRSLDR